MSRQIIINSGIREKRAAILLNEQLEDIFFEHDTYEQIAGNIYKGLVRDVLPGMQAAFVDIGIEKNAFLHINDLYLEFNDEQRKLYKKNKLGIQHVLHPGKEIMVQVVKEEIGSKGPKITCKITLPGRYYVLMPGDGRINISRKIKDDKERGRLKGISADLCNDKYGVIIRTNATGRRKKELQVDLDYLINIWEGILDDYKKSRAPHLIHKHVGLIRRVIRDYLSIDIDKMVVDSPNEYQSIIGLLKKVAPHLKSKVELYKGKE
ncbi:MAG TPA: ribonuclease E/G, partial [Halanaerobiales bacterium]|nr:ribonuclease E/G [Halanaerobiales bacterium]